MLMRSVAAEHQALDEPLVRARAILTGARRVLAITGAGLSADSGLPTYRGVGGLYDDSSTADGVSIEQALSGPMFRRDPALTWKYIAQIESACRHATPNAGHRALANMAEDFERLCILTQNVDGFHRQAGSTDVIEIHGNIHCLQCTGCDRVWDVTDYESLGRLPPICDICGGIVRPCVVLFEEMLPDEAVAAYESALHAGFDAILVVGTSGMFPYISGPVFEAARQGIPTIEINPQKTEVSAFCAVRLQMKAADALTALAHGR